MQQVAVIEDHLPYCKMLDFLFSETPHLHLLHLLNSVEEVPAAFETQLPDVAIMDIDLPGKNGIEGVLLIKQNWPSVKILMLTVFEDSEKIFNAIKAGANGYLLKKDRPSRIIEAVTQVSNGESPINSIIAGKLLQYFQQSGSGHNMEDYNLTTREKEILQHLVNGFSYKEIAAICNITIQTLNSHTKNIYQKLDVHSRAEVAAKFGKNIW